VRLSALCQRVQLKRMSFEGDVSCQ
jgi:hypothetical protein